MRPKFFNRIFSGVAVGGFKKLAGVIAVLGLGTAWLTPAEPIFGQAMQAGTLSCNEAGGWGFIFGSSRDIRCTFSPVSGRPEHYTGSVSKFGVDIGYMQSAVIIWAVAAPTSTLGPGALAGTYVGATANAAAGPGIDANVLVGGSGNTVSLQPVSVQGGVGLDVAGGIRALTLTYQS